MPLLTEKQENYLQECLPKLQASSQLTEQQKLLVELGERYINGATKPQDNKALKILLKAQQAIDKAQHAKIAVKAMLSQQQTKERKIETRQKILIGSLILHNIETNKGSYTMEKLINALDEFLTREQDRKLFGLSEKNADH